MSISRPVGSFPCMFPTNLTNGLSWLASSGIDLFLSLIPLRSRFPRDLAHWARKRSCFLTNKHYILKFLKTSLKSHSKLYLVDMVRWYKYLRKSSIKWYLSLRMSLNLRRDSNEFTCSIHKWKTWGSQFYSKSKAKFFLKKEFNPV